ncbi:MAG TPA: septum site-determining protein MinC [Leptolyngbya sp.]|jgi:septum site-determining protein MinC|nr:septum site-determining protein MinC [Leptolyngbya sp.]
MTSDTSVSPLSNDPTPPPTPSADLDANLPDLPPLDSPEVAKIAIEDLQVRLKAKNGVIELTLPPESESASKVALSWGELWQQFKQLLAGRERHWQPNTTVHLIADDRLLDTRQLSAIADALTEVQLQLKSVHTRRRQTAVVAVTAGYSVEQIIATSPLARPETVKAMEEPLYIQMTLRSGTEIRHNGTVVVLGDLNPGSTIVAEGDIFVWGRLRGVAHAGCKGNARCLIMALQLEPTQIRIADYVARAPEMPLDQYVPEVAYVSPQGNIRIARATDFTPRKDEPPIPGLQNS